MTLGRHRSRRWRRGPLPLLEHGIGDLDDRQIQAGYAEQARERLDWSPDPGRFHLFRVELEDVAFIRYEDASGDQFVSRWPSGREYVRRGTSATSLGPPELRRDLLDGP